MKIIGEGVLVVSELQLQGIFCLLFTINRWEINCKLKYKENKMGPEFGFSHSIVGNTGKTIYKIMSIWEKFLVLNPIHLNCSKFRKLKYYTVQ